MSRTRHVSAGDITAIQSSVVTHTAEQGSWGVTVFDGRLDQPPRFVWLEDTLTIGRGEHCEIALEDAAASREHLRLSRTEQGVQVVDLGSRNGTFVGGRRTQTALLEAGGILRIGATIVRVGQHAEVFVAPSAEGPLVGGTQLAALRRTLSLVAATDLPVLLLGETGTGKDVTAALLHQASGRKGRLVAINCATLPETLAESELFGHVRGAFSGATQARRGLITSAAGGTLFLDEVGELSPAVQAKLLRVLEDKQVRPVGSEQAQLVDVRIVSATNRDLQARVVSGAFRGDLLARLSGVELALPPLRSRIEDLLVLISYLLGRANHTLDTVSADALEALVLYDWPRNVRELDAVLRGAMLGGGDQLTFDMLPARLREHLQRARLGPAPGPPPRSGTRGELEEALRANAGNVRRTSQALGIARAHVYRLAERWSINLATFRPPRSSDDGPDHA
jgi:DNA-binding NtrC family response regulator